MHSCCLCALIKWNKRKFLWHICACCWRIRIFSFLTFSVRGASYALKLWSTTGAILMHTSTSPPHNSRTAWQKQSYYYLLVVIGFFFSIFNWSNFSNKGHCIFGKKCYYHFLRCGWFFPIFLKKCVFEFNSIEFNLSKKKTKGVFLFFCFSDIYL